jgi:ornithine carbamoyltransferase
VTRHLLEIDDLTPDELREVLALAAAPAERVLEGTGGALIFEKPSNRTRNSTEMAVVQLGGHPIYLKPDEVDIDGRESAEDVARTLACFHGVIAARVFDHTVLERMAAVSPVPVVNLLSDLSHPLQAIADLLTIEAEFGDPAGRTIAWIGDYSNVARSLALAAGATGMSVRFGCPDGYAPTADDLARFAAAGAPTVESTTDADEAVEGVDVVVTDAWYSMGQEAEKAVRKPIFEAYRIDAERMARAKDGAIFMHCLPAHRGEEVTDDVLDGPQSRVWPEAANRLPAARAAIQWLVGQ